MPTDPSEQVDGELSFGTPISEVNAKTVTSTVDAFETALDELTHDLAENKKLLSDCALSKRAVS